MATISIAEYDKYGSGSGTSLYMLQEPPIVEQTALSISTSSAQSAAFGTGTKMIRICSDTACRYLVGTNPTATANSMYMDAGQVMELGVTPGHKIAAITTA